MPQRIGRLEFFIWFAVSVVVCATLMGIIAIFTGSSIETRPTYPLSQALCLILATVVLLRSMVSRFHDIGWSGWFVLLMFIPLVGLLVLLFLVVMPGQKEPNAYGDAMLLRRVRRSADNT
jgi:uncharacterized membrane protein YhaH (DUF805 family)